MVRPGRRLEGHRLKDNMAMKMFENIKSSIDVAPWAVQELQNILAAYMADGCVGCAFEDKEEWELPCTICSRNCEDYWRAKEEE
jgi:hypothetical protein